MARMARRIVTSALSLALVTTTGSVSYAQTNAEKTSIQAEVNGMILNKHSDSFPVLSKVKRPEEVGFSSEKLKQVDELIQQDVNNGFPGAVLMIIKDGKIVKNSAYGYAKKYDGLSLLKHPQKMKTNIMFDLASNTKMYAVNFALQHLVSIGKIDLNSTVQSYFPNFKDKSTDTIKGKDSLRLIDILHHTAGFPADPQYHNLTIAGSLYTQDRNETFEKIAETPLEYVPGTKNIYSDVDYMILGFIIEKITGQRLDEYVENTIYKPLGLKNTMFNPLQKGFKPKDFTATELMGNSRDGIISFPNIRTYTIQGEVHDEKAYYSMGGVSGHAGLFSTTSDLAVLLQVMLNGGGYGKVKLFDQKTIDQFSAPSDLNPTYGLGWRRNGSASMSSTFGLYASPNAIGHTGWVGTLTIIDSDNNLGIVLLTNKKHSLVIDPLINPNKFVGDDYATGQYKAVATAVYEALIK